MGVPKRSGVEGTSVTIFRGTFFHTPVYGQLEALRDVVLVLRDGRIAKIAPGSEEAAVCEEFGVSTVRRLQVRDFAATLPYT